MISGRRFTIKPEWQDDGDSRYTWTAITEANPDGYFKARVTGGGHEHAFPTQMDMRLQHVAEFSPERSPRLGAGCPATRAAIAKAHRNLRAYTRSEDPALPGESQAKHDARTHRKMEKLREAVYTARERVGLSPYPAIANRIKMDRFYSKGIR